MPQGSYIRVGPDEVSKWGIKTARHNLYKKGHVFSQRKGAGGYYVITKIKQPSSTFVQP